MDDKSVNRILQIVDKTKYVAIDWQLCVQKVAGNQALAEEFLVKFVEHLHKVRGELSRWMHDKNTKRLGEVVHKLHGSCCFCGVPTLQRNAAQVEKLAIHSASVEVLTTPFAELMQSIDAVISEFEQSKITE